MDLEFWDARYDHADFAYGTEPNDFLVTHASRIPRGRVLCLAEGEGRNGVHLARLGFEVHAVDQSVAGMNKASRWADRNGVQIRTKVADLATLAIEPGRWQGVVSIFAHLPSAARRTVHRRVVEGLAPGGVLILEAYTVRQLEIGGIGGPGPNQKDLFMSLAELKIEFDGLDFAIGREVEREINEGRYHRGRGAVVQVVAIKNR